MNYLIKLNIFLCSSNCITDSVLNKVSRLKQHTSLQLRVNKVSRLKQHTSLQLRVVNFKYNLVLEQTNKPTLLYQHIWYLHELTCVFKNVFLAHTIHNSERDENNQISGCRFELSLETVLIIKKTWKTSTNLFVISVSGNITQAPELPDVSWGFYLAHCSVNHDMTVVIDENNSCTEEMSTSDIEHVVSQWYFV